MSALDHDKMRENVLSLLTIAVTGDMALIDAAGLIPPTLTGQEQLSYVTSAWLLSAVVTAQALRVICEDHGLDFKVEWQRYCQMRA